MGGINMKKRILLLLVCGLISIGSFDAAAYPVRPYTEEEALVTAFESSGADILESTISCWVKINDEFLGLKQLEAEMQRIVSVINPERASVIKSFESGDRLNKMVLSCTKANKAYIISVESVKQETAGETYVLLDVSMDRSCKGLSAERQVIVDALQVDEDLINFSSCIIGTYDGKLEEKDVDKKSAMALRAINAKKVEGIENEEFRSISAFSANVKGYVASGPARVNVQLAARYSSYDDKTYIWIGTPLIPAGY